jgi:DNA-binding NarL/FixJ family response regulator/signal transduction histidine kinase
MARSPGAGYRERMTVETGADGPPRALRALWSARSWRATLHALVGLVAAAGAGAVLAGLLVASLAAIWSLVDGPTGGWWLAVTYVVVAAAGPVALLWCVLGFGAVQRARLRATLGVEIPAPPLAAGTGPLRLVRPWRAAATWRQLGYHLLALVVGAGGGALVAGCWSAVVPALGYAVGPWRQGRHAGVALAVVAAALGMLLAAPWVARGVARLDEVAARALLGPGRSEELALRVASLTRSRADVVAATDAERRRIERDLHDGTQQRLVSLAMHLGMARATLTDAPEPARQAIDQAHDQATQALAELREIVRGLHPAVLDDRGLDAALSGIAARAHPGAPARGRPHPLRAEHRGGRLLRRLRGAHQRRQARQRPPRRGHRPAQRRPAAHRRHRRRPGRGGTRRRRPGGRRRQRAARAGPAGRRGRRDADDPQPARRPDRDHRGAAMRVVIAEDSVLLREGLTKLLADGGFQVAAAVADAEELLRAVAEQQPDLVVVDVRMPPTHTDEGIRAALVIRRQYPSVAVLVLSQYVEERYATDLLSVQTSGVGYLLKDRVAHVADFLDALRRVAAGGTALDPEVVAQLLVRRRSDPIDRLTPRELQVLQLMAEGRSNNGIVEALRVSPSAVEKYVGNIFAKLDLPATHTDHRRVLAVLKFLNG